MRRGPERSVRHVRVQLHVLPALGGPHAAGSCWRNTACSAAGRDLAAAVCAESARGKWCEAVTAADAAVEAEKLAQARRCSSLEQ